MWYPCGMVQTKGNRFAFIGFSIMLAVGAGWSSNVNAQTVSTAPCWRCQWPSGTTDVTIALDWPSFISGAITGDATCNGNMNYTQVELEGLLQRGIDTWNREAGASVRMRYVGLAASNPSARVVVNAICTAGNYTGRVWEVNDPQICGTGPLTCSVHADCNGISGGAGGVCTGGVCVRACASNSTCHAGSICVGGQCAVNDNDTILEINFKQAGFNYDGPWSATAVTDANAQLTHELGHVLGLAHPHDCDVDQAGAACPGGSCTAPYTCVTGTCQYLSNDCTTAGFGDSAVGGSSYSGASPGEPNERRHLWTWDTISIRHTSALAAPYAGRFRSRGGACNTTNVPLTSSVLNGRAAGYGVSTARTIDVEASVDSASPRTWSAGTSNNDTSNAAPAVAWGYGNYTGATHVPSWCTGIQANCDQFVVAFAATTSGGSWLGSTLYTRVANSSQWGGTGLGGAAPGSARTNIRPALAYGNPAGASAHLWVMIHQAADDGRILYQQTSDDGVAWTNPAALTDGSDNFSTSVPPALTYSSFSGQYVLLWADRSTDLMHIAWLDRPDNGATWNGNVTAATQFRSQNGLSLACDDASPGNCLFSFNNDLTSGSGPAQTVWAWRRAAIAWSGSAYATTGNAFNNSEQSRNEMGLAYSPSTGGFIFGLPRGVWSVNHELHSRDRATVDPSGSVSSNNGTTGEETSDGVSAAYNALSSEFYFFYLSNP